MVNLLHLSDLHFGYDTDETARAQRAQALDLLVNVLKNVDRDWRPRIVVISGDLTYQGKPDGYNELGEWLTAKLFPATGLTPADCVICPGNHDINRRAAKSLLKRTGDPAEADDVLRPEDLDEGFARPFKAFVDFATSFGIPEPMLHKRPNYLAGVRDLQGLRFVCVNSAWFCRDSDTDRGQLWLGLPQLQSLALLDPDEYDRAPVTVAVLHHPESWLANAECNAYDNRPNTYGYLCDRAHVILSGHTHGAVERSMRCYDRARLFLGGAAYDNHAYRNNFSILRIDIDRRTVARRPWELDPRGPKWEEKNKQEYSLRIERLGRNEPASTPTEVTSLRPLVLDDSFSTSIPFTDGDDVPAIAPFVPWLFDGSVRDPAFVVAVKFSDLSKLVTDKPTTVEAIYAYLYEIMQYYFVEFIDLAQTELYETSWGAGVGLKNAMTRGNAPPDGVSYSAADLERILQANRFARTENRRSYWSKRQFKVPAGTEISLPTVPLRAFEMSKPSLYKLTLSVRRGVLTDNYGLLPKGFDIAQQLIARTRTFQLIIAWKFEFYRRKNTDPLEQQEYQKWATELFRRLRKGIEN